mmetsp:Transcript_10124/g.15135  ORF Transcript_10124/g.15135 Transcript_10124/m.15135 type:complete len:191 (+) Transcript_10124:700-1272(+)
MEESFEVKIVLLGDSGVGKTSLLQTFSCGEFGGQEVTVNPDFYSGRTKLEGAEVKFQIWDTAGQERFSSLSKVYYRNSDCCVFVYDITNEKTYLSKEFWIGEFEEMNQGRNPPVVVLGNKSDLASKRKVSLSEENFETSAKNQTELSEVFQKIIQKALENAFERKSNGFKLSKEVIDLPCKKSKCCFLNY